MRLLSARTAKLLSEAIEGNYNPYSKAQKYDDTRLKEAIEKHYVKLRKMEQRKYRKPHLSEALVEMANLIGVKNMTETDALSRHDGLSSSDEDIADAEKSSLFSKFTATKRPAGFFGTQPGENNNHSGEINISSVTVDKAQPWRLHRDDTIEKSDQKGQPRSGNVSPVRAHHQGTSSQKQAQNLRALTESNLSKFQKQHGSKKQNLDVIQERLSTDKDPFTNAIAVDLQKTKKGGHYNTMDPMTKDMLLKGGNSQTPVVQSKFQNNQKSATLHQGVTNSGYSIVSQSQLMGKKR